jgi:ABC-2 type transport system permease protein
VADGLRAYCLIVAMWVRSTMAYRGSFLLSAFGNFSASLLDFVAVMIMFSHVDTIGGFTLAEVALLYGASSTSLGLADLLLGNLDRLGNRVRDGSLDALLVRPVPVFLQLAADRFALRRLGRITQGLLILGWSMTQLGPVWSQWSPVEWVLLPVMVLSGAALFGAIFVLGGAFQFWAQDAAQVQDSFTYGGNVMLRFPPTVYTAELVRGMTFVLPLAFVNWVPALRLLDRDDPLGMPGWVDFLSPVVAAVLCLVAAALWRVGLRGYRSTGS